MENMDMGLTVLTKMGADSSAENTPNNPEFSAQFVCPSPKVLYFNEKKALLGVRSPWWTTWRNVERIFKYVEIM